ncbi:MAG: hypothetical protein R3281_13495, partial [Balneolaceae bacterium]|nr:hypothetical protein [Balneolaceae bacterium]
MAALNYRAAYDDGDFTITGINQPARGEDAEPFSGGPLSFRIDKINTLSVSYRSTMGDFDFRSELDFSLLMKLQDGDTVTVPLKMVEITENGFLIPDQTLNETSTPALNVPSFNLGPAEMTLLEFRTLRDISFNWFTGEGIPPAFEMDLEMKLASLKKIGPRASQATISLNNVGFNQGVVTGQIYPYPFDEGVAPVSLGTDAEFLLEQVEGGLTNTGSDENPVQGYDIQLTGHLDYPRIFINAPSNCEEPLFTVNLSEEGGLVGSVNNITPCGQLVYGPATLLFDPDTRLEFSFTNATQRVFLDGGVTANLQSLNNTTVTATGQVSVDITTGQFSSGSILVDDLFIYQYPQTDPLFTFRVQQARLDQNGVVISGDAGLTYPDSPDTARVRFTNFTIHPQEEEIRFGSFTVRDSLGFEVDISPIEWRLVDPSTAFTRDNTARLLVASGATINKEGLWLNGSSEASIRGGGQTWIDLKLDYSSFQVQFAPVRVSSGQAKFTLSDENTPFGHLDRQGFKLNLPGLITSVIPDTLDIPRRNTAFLVLGDQEGNRYELVEDQGVRTLRTLPGETVDLLIPGFTSTGNDTLTAQVKFDLTVDQFFNVNDGSISLQNEVDLQPYVQLPVKISELAYDGNSRQLSAGATVKLPASLSDVDMTSEMVIDQSGFKEGSIATGEYRTTYLPSQENVTPIAADTLGDETLEFYVRGLEIQFGQNRSIGFSGQLKSSLLKDAEGNKSPLHFAAEHTGNDWDFQVDASHLPQNGIDLGYAKVEPIPDPQGSYLGLFDITMDQDEFAVSFAGIISLPDLTGDGFEVTVDQLKIGSAAPYVSIDSQADLPDQNFTLFGDIMTFSTRDISVSFDNRVLAVELDGTFDFYTEQDIAFRGLVFKSDGTVDMQGGLGANLLPEELEMLSDSTLVLKELSLELSNDKLGLAALASAQLPDPLSATSDVRISVDTEGNTDISGPAFVFDEGFSIDGDPTEYKIGSFATLELTGLGLSLNLSDPQYTSLYAAGVIFVENDVNKRIIFGNAGDLERNPGIKYTPNQGVEWNVQSNFDPDSSPLSFDYEFFSVDIESIHIENDVLVDNETVPFQAEIGGKTGLAVKGVEGKVGFSGFKFSTRGVDEIGRIDGGGSFTLMNIFSLELGEFDFNAAPEGETVTLKFVEGQSGGGNPSVDSTEVEVRKYLHFRQGMGGQALGISLTDGISGGIEEVLYYEREDGELFLRIRDASIELHDQAQLSVGMLYKTAGDGGSGASLTVAGGGSISSVGIAAAGKISTLNSQLSFGVFVAAKATVNILGIAEASSLGGGFFYRPDMQDLNMVIDGVEAMDSQFDLNGPQPDVENLKLAILLYAGISVAGVGDQAAISGSGLIQITDQFFKIDVDGVVLNQEGRLEAGSYLTVRYTPELVGAEGNVEIHVDYGEPLNGTATIDFFASKDRTSPGSDILWGITGNMDLTVIEILELNGDFIASPDGMLVDAQLIRGPSTPIISAQSSFKLTAWYIPGYTDPFGIYSQFKAELNIVKGLASIGVGVSGGYFDRGSYHQLYFTGSAYVNAVAFEGRVKGFVKLQNRSPNVKFGKGSNSSMEQMIADARDKADQSSAKADQTRDKIEQANNDLDNSIADHTEFKRTAQQLEKAGFRMLTADQFSYYDRRSMLESVENTAEPLYNSPFESLSYGQSPLDHIFKNILLNIRQPTTSAMPDLRSEASLSVQSTRQAAGPVLNRLEQGRNELQQIADRMDAQLGGDYSGIDNPVENIQTEITGPGGELVSAPGFQVNSETAESNSNRLNTLDNERRQADQRYRQAIEAAAANVQLVDLLLDGTVSIEWGSGTGVQLQPDQQNSVSVIGNKYYNAVRRVRSYNARLIAQYWKLHDWAQQQLEYLENNQSSIESYVEWKNSWSNFANLPGTSNPTLEKVADLAVAMDEAIAEFQGTTPTSNIHSVIMDNSTNSRNKFNELAMDFWYRMPLLGLRAVRDEARDRADELDIEFEDKLSAVNTSYADFTQTIDGLYGIKTDMLTTVYGMIEEYNAWRSSVTDTENQPAEAPFSDQLQSIENALAPPTIDYLEAGVVNAQNDYVPVVDYYSKAFLDFGASHPSGVSEISYNLMENTLSSTYFVQDFYTKGFFVQGASGIRFDFPKRAVNQRTQPLTGVIRARGEGGVTAKRLINIEIPVAPGSQKSSATIVTLGEDTS